MKLDRLISFFSTSPAAKLLRSDHAPYVIFFLQDQFKTTGNITIPHSQLHQQLSEFQLYLQDAASTALRDRPEAYLTNWSTGDTRWLRRFHDAVHAEAVYELSPHTEEVLKFLSEVLERDLGFVGTESRLKRIIDTLSDIVVRGSADPMRRLEHLRAVRERIDLEIRAIESGDPVATYSPTAIRERFADAVSDLTSLQGDFRAVEETFKNITRDVQKRQAESAETRGEILGFALEAEDSLKTQDQGVSFDEFVRLVLSPNQQDELETIVDRLHDIEELAQQIEGLGRIRGMMGSLSEEAEKVLRTTRRLSATLRRLLDTRADTARKRLAAVLNDIRASAVRLADRPVDNTLGVVIFAELDLLNVFQRTFWSAPTRFDAPELQDHRPNEDDRLAAFKHLAEFRRLNWDGMRRSIASALGSRDKVSLPELLEDHPASSGAIEILGYVQLAHDDGHEVDDSVTELIHLDEPADGWTDSYEVPRVVFLNERLRSLRRPLQAGETEL